MSVVTSTLELPKEPMGTSMVPLLMELLRQVAVDLDCPVAGARPSRPWCPAISCSWRPCTPGMPWRTRTTACWAGCCDMARVVHLLLARYSFHRVSPRAFREAAGAVKSMEHAADGGLGAGFGAAGGLGT